MRVRYTSVLSAVMYFVAFSALVCLLGTDFTLLRFSHLEKLITALLFFGFSAVGARLRCIGKDGRARRVIVKNILTVMFLAYLLIVADFTLIDDTFGRSISSIFTCGATRLSDHIKYDVNLIPFKTVNLFLNGYKNGNLEAYATAENLLGNFCVFMPFAFFVPTVFKNAASGLKVLLSVTAMVAAIELLQFVFMTGCADIDDLILNVSGCMAMYGILRIKPIDRRIARATYLVWRNRR